jgi:hypothetical protein
MQNKNEKAGAVEPFVNLLESCFTAAEIEKVFQANIKGPRTKKHDRELYRACNARAAAIAPRARLGHLLPIRTDKGNGCSARYKIAGEEYYTGTWGNGAGYRYAMVDFQKWAERKMRDAGLRSNNKITAIIDWSLAGFRWRSLRLLGG